MNESTLYICLGILTLAFAAAVFIVLLLVPHYDKMRREWLLAKLAAREAREASKKRLAVYESELVEAENIIRAIAKTDRGERLTPEDRNYISIYVIIKEAGDSCEHLLLRKARNKAASN